MDNLFKKYRVDDDVPMTYHKIVRWVILPLSILSSLAILINVLFLKNSSVHISLLNGSHSVIALALSIIIFIGFFDKTPLSWYCTLAFFAERILIEAIALIQDLGDPAFDSFRLIIYFAFKSVVCLASIVYYIKRKPLFIDDLDNYTCSAESDDHGSQAECPIAEGSGSGVSVSSAVQTAERSANGFCPSCGHEVVAGAQFCPECGKKL